MRLNGNQPAEVTAMTGSASELIDRRRGRRSREITLRLPGGAGGWWPRNSTREPRLTSGYSRKGSISRGTRPLHPRCGSTTAVRQGMKTLTKSVTHLPVMRTVHVPLSAWLPTSPWFNHIPWLHTRRKNIAETGTYTRQIRHGMSLNKFGSTAALH